MPRLVGAASAARQIVAARRLRLRVNGADYSGWKSARVLRGIETISGSFDLSVSERWAGHGNLWPIRREDECALLLGDDAVITGYVDGRDISYSSEDHTVRVSGRDWTGMMVDCSAAPGEFWGVSLLTLAKRLAGPFGIAVRMQPGLVPPSVPGKLSVDPGDSAFEALERACRLAGVLCVADGRGGLVLTRAGSERCTTALTEGENILSASSREDATSCYRRYLVTGQSAGNDEYAGDATCTVRGTAEDSSVQRASRVLMVRSESNVTPGLARRRAEWEAKVRSARAQTASVTVQGWTQGDGSLWPVNALVNVRAPMLEIDGELLITQATYSLDDSSGTTTQLELRRPDAFLPEPVVPKAKAWAELAGGVR